MELGMNGHHCALIWEPAFGGRIVTPGDSLPDCIERARNRHGISFVERNQESDRFSTNARLVLEHVGSASNSIAPCKQIQDHIGVTADVVQSTKDEGFPKLGKWLETLEPGDLIHIYYFDKKSGFDGIFGTPTQCLENVKSRKLDNWHIAHVYRDQSSPWLLVCEAVRE